MVGSEDPLPRRLPSRRRRLTGRPGGAPDEASALATDVGGRGRRCDVRGRRAHRPVTSAGRRRAHDATGPGRPRVSRLPMPTIELEYLPQPEGVLVFTPSPRI